jgi:hypothetical protein
MPGWNYVVAMVSELNTSWSHVYWCKFFIHFRSLNIQNFGMVEATALKITSSSSSSMA